MSHNFLQKFNAEKLATTFYSSQCLVVNVKADLELVVCVCLLVVCRYSPVIDATIAHLILVL